MKNLFIRLYQKALSNPTLTKAFHTAWQSFLGVFLVGISPILTDVTSHHFNDAKVALIALLGAAVAAALSTLKNLAAPTIVSWASQDQPHIQEKK